MRLHGRFLVFLLLLSGATALAASRLELRNGDRVVFLGDTFFEREGSYGHIEASLTAAHPDTSVVYRNLSWAADTPMGRSRASFDWNKPGEEWLKRVGEQVALVRPTVALLSYGMTAALEMSEAPNADSRGQILNRFLREMRALMRTVESAGEPPVRFAIIGPISRQTPAQWGEPGRVPARQVTLDESLLEVNRALEGLARETQSAFADLISAESLRSDRYSARREPNGIHLNEAGYRWAAGVLTRSLTGRGVESGDALQEWSLLTDAIRQKNEQFFHRWRPANWTYLFGFRKHEQGQNAVEIPKFEPLVEEWDRRIAALRNLKAQDPSVASEVREILSAQVSGSRTGKGNGQAALEAVTEQPTPEFDVHEGFEVSLWAENPMLFKPIQINWDPQGRLWVASSRVYPQIRPGQAAEDSIVVLEDRDGDGLAETSTEFASGLLIPTGVVPDGRGGCYVAASHELLHFADEDGDGRADRRTIVLSSFGTEDTHHNLHTLRWGYDGYLYFNQSIYTHTHVETPYGVRRLNSAGIWRFHPDTWSLEIFTKGGCNPWGHHWDQYGNHFFTDGAGFKGVYHAMEGATYFTYADMRREAESISPGNHPKFCSIEMVNSPAFPADWQGQLITCDFRAHRIVRFGLREAGSSFRTVEMPDLLRSTQVTFRPIDLRFGPDGALYIADWSNPIIQHGEVDFRDPRRDKEHGRIWRVRAKAAGTALAADRANASSQRDLSRLNVRELLDRTLSKNGWEQEQARLLLRQARESDVLPEADRWLAGQKDSRAKLEVMWLKAIFGRPVTELVRELAASRDERLRTVAAQQLAR